MLSYVVLYYWISVSLTKTDGQIGLNVALSDTVERKYKPRRKIRWLNMYSLKFGIQIDFFFERLESENGIG